MKRGTLSLLFGVHQFLWHPIVVGRAWRMLYGRWPDRYEWLAIITHDLGYWGLPNMDGPEGVRHPVRSQSLACWAARRMAAFQMWRNKIIQPIASQYVSYRVVETGLLVRHHSREMVRIDRKELKDGPLYFMADEIHASKLCWPDKLSIVFEPEWFYLFRARLTGELEEFRLNAIKGGYLPATATNRDWFRWYRTKVCHMPEIRELLGS